MKVDLARIETTARAAQGRYDPEILAEVGVYHGNAAKFVAEVGTPDVVLALVARIRQLEAMTCRECTEPHGDCTPWPGEHEPHNPSLLDEMLASLESKPDAVGDVELSQEFIAALCSDD